MQTPVTVANIGLRIKYARELRGLTQVQLASEVGFKDHQTVSTIEMGDRAVRTDELLKFSDALDQDVEFFLDPLTVIGEATFSWRASYEVEGDILDAFEAKAGGWIGMQRWLRSQGEVKPDMLGSMLRVGKTSTFEDAQAAAEQLVARLQLGTVPALTLPDVLETKLDVPVLFVDMPTDGPKNSISGAACHLVELGAILVNRREGAARRNFDLAHELFHTLTWESMTPARLESNNRESRQKHKRVEQLADNFAGALLMPTSSLDRLIKPAMDQNAMHLTEIASKLQVSTEALGWRLKSLNRITEPARLALSQLRSSPSSIETPKLFSSHFVRQLHVALEKGRLTARKAAKTLALPLHELAELFEAYELSDPTRS